MMCAPASSLRSKSLALVSASSPFRRRQFPILLGERIHLGPALLFVGAQSRRVGSRRYAPGGSIVAKEAASSPQALRKARTLRLYLARRNSRNAWTASG